MTDHITHNREAYDAAGAAYDDRHAEIFNEVEQARLRATVARALAAVASGRQPPHAADIGSGTGNLTAHFLAAGARVTSADLSTRLLEEVARRFSAHERFTGTVALNGNDLRPMANGTFDLTAAYSVLHHVPDYLALVAEMARVTAPGGVVYIDHERSDESWTSPAYAEFLRQSVIWPRRRWWYWLQPHRYWKRIKPYLEWRRWGNPRWMPEGDIHIWPDDHIEWPRVLDALRRAGCEVVACEDYLLFEPRYDRAVYDAWAGRAADMRYVIARKAGAP